MLNCNAWWAGLLCLSICGASKLRILPQVTGEASQHLIGLGIEDVNHELYGGLYSQMVYGEDFEEPAGSSGVSGDFSVGRRLQVSPTWTALPADARGSPAYEIVDSKVFNGHQAQLLMANAGAPAQILNRGLYQQGMHFKAEHTYEGYLYARLSQGQPASVTRLNVSLVSATVGEVLDSTQFAIQSNEWTRFNFTLRPEREAGCWVTKESKNSTCLQTPEGECVLCEGGLLLSVSGGAVVLDFVFLQPGLWGRYEGLPVRKDVAEMLVTLGVNALRLGGSMCNVDDYRWKKMRGPREHRQPYTGLWHPYASQGWRIFEFLEFCEHLGVQAVVTLNDGETPEDLADLVEYAYGGVDTPWGQRRLEDGHPEKFKPFIVEIGNEQGLDYQLVRAVADGTEAMRVRASVIGMDEKELQFAIGHNLDMALINTPICDTMVNATKFLGDRIMWDFHVAGDKPGEVDHWNAAFEMAEEMLDRLKSKMRLAVFEENAEKHDIIRGLNRARYANTYARLGKRFVAGTAANGLQVFGYNDNGRWDQGAVFMTPDRVWLSPFGYVDFLVSRASLPMVLETQLETFGNTLDISASRSEDFASIALRVVNYDAVQTASLSLELPNITCTEVLVQELKVPSNYGPSVVNPPSNPTRVAPTSQKLEQLKHWEFQALSLTTLVWSRCKFSAAIFV